MVAATSSRSIYIFVVKTTLQQDLELIAKQTCDLELLRLARFYREQR